MEKLNYVEMTRSRYTDLFSEDPVFDALVQTITEYKMNVQDFYLKFADTILDIDKSTGKNLDLIGSIVGQDRVLVDYYSKNYFGFEGNPKAEPFDQGEWFSLFGDGNGGDSRVLNDEEYRRLIKARIIRNKTNCTRVDMIKILDLLMDIDRDNPKPNDSSYTIKHNGHGNIILDVKEVSDKIATHYLINIDREDNIIPKPLGYRLSVNIVQ